MRTKTVINNTYEFGVKRRLHNFDDLKEVGIAANRRLLDVQRISYNCPIGVEAFDAPRGPVPSRSNPSSSHAYTNESRRQRYLMRSRCHS